MSSEDIVLKDLAKKLDKWQTKYIPGDRMIEVPPVCSLTMEESGWFVCRYYSMWEEQRIAHLTDEDYVEKIKNHITATQMLDSGNNPFGGLMWRMK